MLARPVHPDDQPVVDLVRTAMSHIPPGEEMRRRELKEVEDVDWEHP